MMNLCFPSIRLSFLPGLFLLASFAHFSCESPEQPANPQIILKLDDLWFEDGLVHEGWERVFAFLNEEKITGTIGLVCNSLEEGNEEYFSWIKERAREGHEIWHHGYCHCKPTLDEVEHREFRGTDYTYQAEHLKRGQQLAKEKLDLTFRSFGAPYNSTDTHTAKALEEIPDIKIWLYKESDAPTSKYLLNRIAEVNIEYPVHVPDFSSFKEGYEKYKSSEVLIIQGHPRSWVKDAESFEEFKRIIHFLQSQDTPFTTPYEYYLKDRANQ